MHNENKLSLLSAIFININIMIGAGLFINTTNLAQMVGAAGAVSYAILAILLYPLIASIATLVTIYPVGGFYAYSKDMHQSVGFISAWSYFVGKLASATILTHASVLLLQQIIPLLAGTNTYLLDSFILTLFLGLNFFNLQTGSSIQSVFLGLKLIPILFVIGTGLYLFSPAHYQPAAFIWPHLIDTLPFVLFAALGFEATTSLSGKIKDAKINGPRAILMSYGIVVTINIAYQLFFYGSVGEQLQQAYGFLEAFPLLLNRLFILDGQMKTALQTIFNIAIASSALGGAYGILFSNSWNLNTLARYNLITTSKLFLKENRYGIPYGCIIAEGIICFIYLMITGGAQIQLQQIAAFGCTIAYTLSVINLFRHTVSTKGSLLLPSCAIFNCLIFLFSCIHSFATKGYQSLTIFGSLMIIGLCMYYLQQKKNSSANYSNPVRAE